MELISNFCQEKEMASLRENKVNNNHTLNLVRDAIPVSFILSLDIGVVGLIAVK